MSNYLAIATVTAAFKRMLQAGVSREVPGTQVTTVRPESSSGSGSISGTCINLFMYSAVPNPAWRNADLRTRRPKVEMTKHGQAGLDLNYILTFYGNEQRLEPQRLLGSAIQTLVDNPVLTSEMIQDTINSNLPELAPSTLDEQVQSVKFLPDEMTTDELSRLWSVFFQIPYSLSFTYRATAVLIQGRKPGKAPLPVRGRRFYTSPTSAALTKVEVRGALGEPCTLDSYVIIHGRQLTSAGGRIQFGEVSVEPTVATDTQFELDLAALPTETRSRLRAGVQGVCLQLQQPQSSPGVTAQVTTNVMPLVLCPVILYGTQDITVDQVEEIDDQYCSATVTVRVDVVVDPEQSVFLLLNGEADSNGDGTTIVRGDRRSQPTHQLTFTLDKVKGGEHLVRVQIGGAESPLEVDSDAQSPTHDQYIGPMITIRADSLN
ncbi:MAG: DUF4255 domain-containing protein [Cyanobacteria bacterium P01_F01_bin.150]